MKTSRALGGIVATPLAILGVLSFLSAVGRGSIAEFQAAASSHPDLIHQYTFDGSDEVARREDKKGTAHLSLQLVGTGLATDLEYAVPGFDDSSEAVKTSRGPGTDNANGAYLRTESVTWGQSVSFEVLVQPSEPEISGGQFNLAYILSTRGGTNDRGYFLTQGGPLPSMGVQFASSIGDGHNDGNTNTILPGFTVGNWYYVSGSYTIGAGNVTWTNYVADLTAGETTLTQVGPFTNSGGTYPTVPGPLGVGGRWDAQESFPGLIDEITFYNAALAGEEFQNHLNLITGASGLGLKVARDGGDLVFTWPGKAGKKYNLRSESGLSTDPASWPIFDGNADIEPTEPENTLTIPLPADAQRFFAIEEFTPPPVVIFLDDFESGQGGWTTDSEGAPGSDWELGPPTDPNFGPTAARSGANCFGTNLGGATTDEAYVWLRSPPIDLTTAAQATLSYFEFRDIESMFDFGTLAILDATDDLLLVEIETSIDGASVDWEEVSRALPAEALGNTIKIEFRYETDDFTSLAGWYIDDVEVSVR